MNNDSWWDEPERGGGGDTPVIRHAPDDDQYHMADDPSMVGKMRGSLVGRFAIIPAADKDGASKAFDPSVAGPCHVDPGAPDGGVVFDPSMVHKGDVDAAVARSRYPHQVFYQLGKSARDLGFGGRGGFGAPSPSPRSNSKMPRSYIAPQSNNDGRQMQPEPYPQAPSNVQYRPEEYTPMAAQPNLGPLPPLPAGPAPYGPPQPPPQQPQYYPPPQQPQQQAPYNPYPGYPPQPDPNMTAMMNALVGLQNQVSALAGARVAPPPAQAVSTGYADQRGGPPAGLSSVPVELRQQRRRPPQQSEDDDFADDTARPIRRVRKPEPQEEEEQAQPRSVMRPSRQTVREYDEATREQPPEAVITGFETLALPWLNGPLPNKPRRKVFFDIPGAGTHSTMYHDVIITDTGDVVLVYDTRYEEGTQYLPPNLGAETAITLTIPTQAKKKSEEITARVCSLGINYAFGVFDMIVLVKKEEDEVE